MFGVRIASAKTNMGRYANEAVLAECHTTTHTDTHSAGSTVGQARLCFTLSILSDPDAELRVSEVVKMATYDSDMTNPSSSVWFYRDVPGH